MGHADGNGMSGGCYMVRRSGNARRRPCSIGHGGIVAPEAGILSAEIRFLKQIYGCIDGSLAVSQPLAVIAMGVTGSGKTTIGKMLAARIGCDFYDGDDFHPQANIDKMRQGHPLDDDDRAPWLDKLRELLTSKLAAGQSLVLACSALKDAYRNRLLPADANLAAAIRFLYLHIDPATARYRLEHRPGHFMPASLVDSQFETLEEPDDALEVDATGTPDSVVTNALRALRVPA